MLSASHPVHIVATEDKSPTLFSSKYGDHFHSIHGAWQESLHVFIRAGLEYVSSEKQTLNIFEMGFGTGLNVFLTFLNAGSRKIIYQAIDADPLGAEVVKELDYAQRSGVAGASEVFTAIHAAPWGRPMNLSSNFVLQKNETRLEDFSCNDKLNLVFFDAFSPDRQPQLWTEEIFKKIYSWCSSGAVFVTYSSKGSVRRALASVGFTVEKIPGPPGKREMIRAIKR